MTPHDAIREQFVPMVDGELTAEQADTVRQHLADCDECRGLFEKYRRTLHLVQTLPRVKAPSELTHKVLERVAKAHGKQRKERTRAALTSFSLPLAIAIALLIAAMVTVAYLLHASG